MNRTAGRQLATSPDATTRRARRGKLVRRVVVYVLLALVLLAALFPFYWMILTSFRTQLQNTSPVPVWFFTPTWKNYVNVVRDNSFLLYTWNSLVVAFLSTAIGLLLGLPAAYSIARFKQDGLAIAILVARLTPYITYIIPWYILFRTVGLLDTYAALTISHLIVGMPLIVWLMIGFFEAVPTELEEAAFIDGASRIGTFVRVILPLSLPGIVAASILAFIFSWNQFLFSLVLAGTETKTVPVAAFNFISYGEVDYGGLGAAAVLITAPVLILTLLIQRYIVAGLAASGVKG